MTAFALVKVYARIDRHDLSGPKPAIRARKHGLEDRGGLHRAATDVAGNRCAVPALGMKKARAGVSG